MIVPSFSDHGRLCKHSGKDDGGANIMAALTSSATLLSSDPTDLSMASSAMPDHETLLALIHRNKALEGEKNTACNHHETEFSVLQ
jgi:hypothetical protein